MATLRKDASDDELPDNTDSDVSELDVRTWASQTVRMSSVGVGARLGISLLSGHACGCSNALISLCSAS
jgi:hypothetical protein